jgi:hypothetical protein
MEGGIVADNRLMGDDRNDTTVSWDRQLLVLTTVEKCREYCRAGLS